jgi:RNA polymerase sigma-70 factor (ECF subfamily)
MRRQEESAAETMLDAPNLTRDLWHALSEDLHAFLRSRVPSESDADDILQDIFVRVVENVGSLRHADRIESWVYQVARNAVADFYRRRGPLSAEAGEKLADPHGRESGTNQNRAVAVWLSLMFNALPTTLRDAVRMYEIEGLPQQAIADRLGISLSGAKSRVQRGRQQLERLLRNSCQLEIDRRGNIIACKPAREDGCAQVSCECADPDPAN